MSIAGEGPTIQWAERYYEAGWSVLPLKPGTKQPALRKWKPFTRTRATPDQIARWWDRNPGYGIGVVCGDVSDGLVIRDFDSPQVYEAFRTRYRAAADALPTVSTSPGRRQVYCRTEPQQVLQRFGVLCHDFGEGNGELRAGNCIAVAPPTLHPSGVCKYQWINGSPEQVPFVSDLSHVGFFDQLLPEVVGTQEGARGTQDGAGPFMTTEDEEGGDGDATKANANRRWTEGPLDERIEAAIAETLPDRYGVRRLLIFEFGRRLKAMPECKDKPATELLPLMKRWWERARLHVRDKAWIDTWTEFQGFWDGDKIRVAHGDGPMIEIVQRAKANVSQLLHESYEYTLLVELCRELQRHHGAGKPFFLTSRKAAEFCGISDHKTAWKWLKVDGLMESDGWVKCVKVGTRQKGSEYLFQKPV